MPTTSLRSATSSTRTSGTPHSSDSLPVMYTPRRNIANVAPRCIRATRGEGSIVKSFSRLSERGQVRRLRRIGAAALSRYNLQAARITFVQRKTNAIFRITTLSRGEFVLRVHPASQATATVIEGELRWLEAIGQETDLRVPVPEPAEDGALVVTCEDPEVPEPLHCVLLRWLPGRRRRPQHLSKIELAKVGMVVGELHRHAAHFTLPPGY